MIAPEQMEAEVASIFNDRMKNLIGALQTDLVEAQTRAERTLRELISESQNNAALVQRVQEQQAVIAEQRRQIVELKASDTRKSRSAEP